MRYGKACLAVLLVFLMAYCITGCSKDTDCGASEEELRELGAIDAVVREDGSGTRDVFEEISGAVLPDEMDAASAGSSEKVVEAVGIDVSAIGYVSAGSTDDIGSDDESGTSVKVLSVEGVLPDDENVESGDYPLTRSFGLAYSGELSDLERDFLTYVLGKGQNVVAKYSTPVKKTGETEFLSGRQEGMLIINGSTSALPLVRELADAYAEENPNAQIIIEPTDSKTGIDDAIRGKCDFAMVSRDLEDYEAELLGYEAIARDGIAVIVNGENPVTNITMEQIKDIFSGEMTEWTGLVKD